ncbi:MAG: M28 family peptidase [Xanthomonadales bacterium]|nr:M28 family peptidase [Xanthomonadales bacterium]
MPILKARSALLFLSLVSSSALAVDSALETALSRVDGDEIARHVSVLASDEFEGRMTGTRGEDLTVEYIARQFEAAGLEPGANGSWFQPVPLRGIRARTAPTLQLNAGGETFAWEYREHWVAGAQVYEDSVVIEGSELVFVGYGIRADQYDWDDLKGLDVAGKTVIFLYGDPGQATANDTLFQGRAMSRFGTRQHKAELMATLGAVAAFWVHDQETIGYPWSVFGDSNPKWSYSIAKAVNEPSLKAAGVIRKDSLRALFERAGLDFDAALTAAARRDFKPVSLGMRVTMRFDNELKSIHSRNVIGLLRGATRPDETVIYTAHWDHEGTDEKLEGDQIFNGAVDNATGTAVLMHLARIYGGLEKPPARSIVFIATTAEERGLLGSYYYADNPVYPLRDTVAVINMDALFPFGQTKGMTVTALGSSEIEEYMSEAAQRVGRKLYSDGAPEAGAYFRSDHYPFAAKGVPAVFAVGGPAMEDDVGETVDINRWYEYVGTMYHKPADEYDPLKWDMAGIVQDASIFFETGYLIANAPARPNWYPDNEFRPLRDRMLDSAADP